MTPQEHRTPEIDAIKQAFETLPGGLGATENLTLQDMQIIGIYTQTYCFIEFNQRRSLEVMAVAGLLSGKAATNPHRLHLTRLIRRHSRALVAGVA